MSYRDRDDVSDTPQRRFYWPSLDSLEESYEVARKAFGGWIFAGMILLGGLFTYFSGKSLADLKTPENNMAASLAGVVLELAFVLFASYRMVNGRGWLISWFLLAIFLAEAVIKIASGSPGAIGWIIFYVAVGSSILSGARACWDIHKRVKEGETLQT